MVRRAPTDGGTQVVDELVEARGALTFCVDLVPRTVLRRLLAAVGVLLLASVAGQVLLREAPQVPLAGGIAHSLYVDSEQSLPTVFSVLLLGAAAALLGAIAACCRRTGVRDASYWLCAAGLALLLALDEYLSLHEQLIDPLRGMFGSGPGGMLHYAWVVPGLLAALVIALLFVPFLGRLPAPFRSRLLLCGALYLSGAIGVEMLGGAIENAAGDRSGYVYLLATTVEEGVEMTAIVVLLHTLLGHLAQTSSALTLSAGLRDRTAVSAYPPDPVTVGRTSAGSSPGRPGPRTSAGPAGRPAT